MKNGRNKGVRSVKGIGVQIIREGGTIEREDTYVVRTLGA